MSRGSSDLPTLILMTMHGFGTPGWAIIGDAWIVDLGHTDDGHSVPYYRLVA